MTLMAEKEAEFEPFPPLPNQTLSPKAPPKEPPQARPTQEQRSSWAHIVTPVMNQLLKHNVSVQILDGTTSASIPEDILEDPHPLWKNFVIGRFLDTAPHIAKIHIIVNKIWVSGGNNQRIDVQVMDERTIKFSIQNESARNRVLRRGMWNIADVPMVVNEWSPEALKETPPLKSIPIWVDFKNIPAKLYSNRGLGWLASHVGHPIKLHSTTEACSNFEKARIFVEVNLETELPKRINLSSKAGIVQEVQVEYSWLPPRCPDCKKWGHKQCGTDHVKPLKEAGSETGKDPSQEINQINNKGTDLSPRIAQSKSENPKTQLEKEKGNVSVQNGKDQQDIIETEAVNSKPQIPENN